MSDPTDADDPTAAPGEAPAGVRVGGGNEGTVADEGHAVEIERPALPGDSRASRLWRAMWRTHFYSAFIAMPALLLFALTGLVILYTEPIQQLVDRDLATVEVRSGEAVSLDDQLEAVTEAYPDLAFVAVTPPKEADLASRFTMADEGGSSYEVYVDPYTGEVQGRTKTGDDIVGLANRLHGFLNNESVTVSVPTVAGLLGPDPLLSEQPVGDLALEVFAGWALILALSGLYVWWPRKRGTGKALFVPRLGSPGRARWRDLHAVGGSVLGALLIFFVLTGLPWSAAWGSSWAWAASEITPNQETSFWEWEGPASAIPVTGDLDRLGNRIPWATGQDQVPASGGGHHHDADEDTGSAGGVSVNSPSAEPASLQLIKDAADDEGMLAGYTINAPVDVLDDPERPFYGAFTVFNPWPTRMADQGALYLDQFSGETLAVSTAETWGELQWATEWGIQTHMGTQYGLASRIVMTLACVLVIWSMVTGLVMWNKRRRKGTLGLPRRPTDVRIQRVVGITALVLAIVYPLWGLSLVAVLLIDRFLIRRNRRLKAAFGQR